MAVPIPHEVIKALRIKPVIATSGPFLKLSLGSDKRWQKLYLTWIKFRIVAHELSSMLDWLFLKR